MSGPDDVAVGTSMETVVEAPVTVTDSVRYQGASGDMNPMHHDADRARERGYRDAFTVGMLPAGILASAIDDWIEAGSAKRFQTRFRSQVWPGDVLTYRAEVVATRGVERGTEIDVSATVTNQDGTVCLGAEGTWVIHYGV